MTAHPNRNWRRRWRVNLDASTAVHEPTGIVVRFEADPDDPGAWDGEVIDGVDAITTIDGQALARLMREAGDIYREAIDARH